LNEPRNARARTSCATASARLARARSPAVAGPQPNASVPPRPEAPARAPRLRRTLLQNDDGRVPCSRRFAVMSVTTSHRPYTPSRKGSHRVRAARAAHFRDSHWPGDHHIFRRRARPVSQSADSSHERCSCAHCRGERRCDSSLVSPVNFASTSPIRHRHPLNGGSAHRQNARHSVPKAQWSARPCRSAHGQRSPIPKQKLLEPRGAGSTSRSLIGDTRAQRRFGQRSFPR
jgi:hypothetical protein